MKKDINPLSKEIDLIGSNIPINLNWNMKLNDFIMQCGNSKKVKPNERNIFTIGLIEIFNKISGEAQIYFSKKGELEGISIFLATYDDLLSSSEFNKVKSIMDNTIGDSYTIKSYSGQQYYCWNIGSTTIKLWKGCMDKMEIDSTTLRIEKNKNIC